MISRESGEMNPLLIPFILVILLMIGAGVFAGWAYLNYTDQRDNTQSKIDVAVAAAKQEQQEEDNKAFAEREKEPYRQFVGPSDLGRVEFNYPKTWSVYIDNGGGSGEFEAYLHPTTVHPIDDRRPYAVKVMVESSSYETTINGYQSRVRNGDLRSDPVTVNGFNGVRLSGNFSKDITNGTAVIFKVRDKTLSIFSETQEFFPDFDNIILESLRFNP